MKLILAISLLCICQILHASPSEREVEIKHPQVDRSDHWEEHKKKFGLNFTVEEEDARRANYMTMHAFINEHNANPNHTSVMGHNHLSHLHESEKKAMRGARPPPNVAALHTNPVAPPTDADERSYPSSLDWRAYSDGKNYVSPIQSQGSCGSCWTFSATATLESRWAFVNQESVSKFSEQNILDCCHTGSTNGNNCNGGWYTDAWAYVASYKGFAVSDITGTNDATLPKGYIGQNYLSSYPYTGEGSQSCSFSDNHIGGWSYPYKYGSKYYASYNIQTKSASAFKKALQSGPISVAIDASGNAFSAYASGTLQASSCGTSLDHAVNCIGYGSDDNGDYWLLRNSWGTSWGLSGYMKFERTDTEDSVGTCGILTAGAYPNVVKYEG